MGGRKMIYLTSDLHFNHNQEFIWKERGFNSIEEMNEEIIKRFNSVVQEEDDIYILGDLCMSADLSGNKQLIERLNGRLHIIYGNHDTENRMRMYCDCKNVVELCGYATVIKYRKYSFYLSHYPTNTGNYDDDGRGLKGRMINICGHIHAKNEFYDMDNGQMSYHIEMDAHNCYPVSIEEVIITLKNYYYSEYNQI
jgi:calcineurin-like phosphoesterase family protein